MKLLTILPLLLISSTLIAGPSCNWVKINTKIESIKSEELHIEEFKCVIPNWDTSDEPNMYKAYILKTNGETIKLVNNSRFNSIKLHEYKDLNLNILSFRNSGSSNIGNSIRVYNKNWELIKTFNKPLNEYQTANRKGSETEIVGFFNINNRWYIENLRSTGGECNACQSYVVDTYEVIDTELVLVDTRDYYIDKYERYLNKD